MNFMILVCAVLFAIVLNISKAENEESLVNNGMCTHSIFRDCEKLFVEVEYENWETDANIYILPSFSRHILVALIWCILATK